MFFDFLNENRPPPFIDRGLARRKRVSRTVPYWKESHWKFDGARRYTGFYRTLYGAYRGEIAFTGGSRWNHFYIVDPPPGFKRHRHGACFMPRGGGRYELHFSKPPATVDAGIVHIEQILTEIKEQFWK